MTSFSDNPVQCDYPLPEPQFQRTEFGTWDLGPRRARYLITTDGRLRRFHLEVNLPLQHDRMPVVVGEGEDTNYHGDISLYASAGKVRLEYRVRFTRGTVEWIRRKEDGVPVDTDSLKTLARDAWEMEQEHRTRLEALFRRLEKLDNEAARQSLAVFGDVERAGSWLGTALSQFGNRSCYQLLARGQRRKVLEALTRIDSGFFA